MQQLAELDVLPEVIETSLVRDDGTETKKVCVCRVSFNARETIKEKADVSDGVVDNVLVLVNGDKQYAAEVKALKKGVMLGDKQEKAGKRVQGEK